MKIFKTSIDIAAPVDEVWRVLTEDLPRDPNPFGLLQIDGTLAAGSRIRIRSELDPKRVFALTITDFEPPHGMVWRGGMPLGLFTGTRTFSLSLRDQTTRFDMKEVFSGFLSGLIAASIPDLTPSFEKFANALKEKAEQHD
ncbi:SRPBCC domain-containing protein [Roseibium sp. MMSF_3544]|uniref:SRPBCC domain-containing protein n=1 Tax=unclassified Roseibium TaxID=2629323 RepID=UPI00273DE535|nr:SRPBCC domain-containing protein [Roseibium sp. MMSF_3544]